MYFPIGWPKVLHGRKATQGLPVKLLRHKSRNIVIELRSHSVAFWHTRLCVLLSSYVRSSECVENHGSNITAAIKSDGTVLAIATSAGYLLFLRIQYEKPSSLVRPGTTRNTSTTKEHGIFFPVAPHLEGTGEGKEIEVATVTYLCETAIVGGDVVDILNVGALLMVSTGYGVLARLSWEGCYTTNLAMNINDLPVSNDLDTRGQPHGGPTLHARHIVYSPVLHGFSLVLSDGRGIFLTSRMVRYDSKNVQGVWLKGLKDAICTAVNSKYRLLAFGKKNGVVEVYSGDETMGTWNLSHTLEFTRRQFPETGVLLGEVQCMEWSEPDGMVIAVSWKNGGLSLWSVFGSLLLCSLGDQPGTPSPLNPHCTILETMCWSSDGYHLWMLTSSRDKQKKDLHGDTLEGCGQVLVMQFMRNAIVSNPIVSNHHHLFLQGSDKLYLNASRTVAHHKGGAGINKNAPPTINGTVSSPQWKVIPLPSNYMILNWPIRYAAVSQNGRNLGVAGKAGFALYSSAKRKWKLFGNEVQEQGLTCQGGLAWYHDVLVFPCRWQDKNEEVRFYSLHFNLDNSQLLDSIKTTSPIIKINLHGNLLFLASRDCHVTIMGLKLEMLPNKGLVLSLSKLHEINLTKSLSPWAHSLVAMVPSNVRTEPTSSVHPHRSHGDDGEEEEGVVKHNAIDSILFNISGRILMIQQNIPHLFSQDHENEMCEWDFSPPVCLAASVETMWIPPVAPSPSPCTGRHISESLWLACGWEGIKVWLPLFPRDEGHPTFLSKRIMLTLPCSVYPQVIMFNDAIVFGLSHEVGFSENSLSSMKSFPFATIERTTNIFLHHILRQLLRRNLGSHALQIAQSFSHLPYFSHVLELMLHEILEEEAPGSMPVPDALLPRVVEFIKQFPEFLETVGHCARKTEVALWQYLFAAVGNPRDLFEWCITDSRLQTAATYLIIIQNLEVSSVSRQLATRLLDASLESNNWSLCRDLVRFLKAIGSGDALDTPTSMTPHKIHTPTSAVFSSAGGGGGGASPSAAPPDLDRSAVMGAKDHLSSGSTSSSISLSGDYRDSAGKIIRRPNFVMDVDSKEDYFIELILSRHARKLLTVHSLRDLGCFAAHLDFSLSSWLAREKLRAAKVEDFSYSLQELHKEFQWPYPPPCPPSPGGPPPLPPHPPLVADGDSSTSGTGSLFSPTSTIRCHTSNDIVTTPTDDDAKLDSYSEETDGEGERASLRRALRPPNLDLSTSKIGELAHNVTLESTQLNSNSDLDPTQSSTPTRQSGSVSERVSLVMKNNLSSLDLHGSSSMGDLLEESDWDINSEVAMATGRGGVSRGSSSSEKEIRYFADVMLDAGCADWAFLFSMLLLDKDLIGRTMEAFTHTNGCQIDRGVVNRCIRGIVDLGKWAESECSGYIPFLESLEPHLHHLNTILLTQQHSTTKTTPLTSQQAGESQLMPTPTWGLEKETDNGEEGSRGSSSEGIAREEGSTCVIS